MDLMDGCDYFVLARVSTIEFTDFEGIKINAKLYVFNIFIYMVKFQEVAPKKQCIVWGWLMTPWLIGKEF